MHKLVIATGTAALLLTGIGTATADPASTTPSATAVSDSTTGSSSLSSDGALALSSSSVVQAPIELVTGALHVFVCGVYALSGTPCV